MYDVSVQTFSSASSTLSGMWSLIIVGDMSTSWKSSLSAQIALYVGSSDRQQIALQTEYHEQLTRQSKLGHPPYLSP